MRFSPDGFRSLGKTTLLQEVPDTSMTGDDDLNPDWGDVPFPASPRAAAVLLPIIARPLGLTLMLTRRSQSLKAHPGQIAFPGGTMDKTDTGPLATALREMEEETGIAPATIEPLGYLDRYRTRTGFSVVPVVGLISGPCAPVPMPGEVDEIFEIPLPFLMDRANHQLHSHDWLGRSRISHAMNFGAYHVWGVTGGIIHALWKRMDFDGLAGEAE